MIRVVFIGCVDFSYALAEKVMTLPDVTLVGIVTRRQPTLNADRCSLAPLADRAKIPCFFDDGNSQAEMATWIRSLSPDLVYCFGWSYLLSKEILQIPRIGAVGYHPAALPKNRGRHPIVWALALGLNETASSFFLMNEDPDSGDLLSQERIEVSRKDDAKTLYNRLKNTALSQVEKLTPLLASGTFERVAQDHTQASYWRKRNQHDGKIDWRMSAEGIYNLVRALTKPYVGAHLEYEGREVKVWRCEVATQEWPFEQIVNLEPGRVLRTDSSRIEVRCGDGVVRLTRHEFQTLPKLGAYL